MNGPVAVEEDDWARASLSLARSSLILATSDSSFNSRERASLSLSRTAAWMCLSLACSACHSAGMAPSCWPCIAVGDGELVEMGE